MLPWLTDHYGNTESLHDAGIAARTAVETARQHVAALVGAEDPSQIVFTAGATEGCNWAVRLFGSRAVRSPFEHSAVAEPSDAIAMPILDTVGWNLVPDRSGSEAAFVIKVSNETGAVFDPRAIGPAFVFSDITQALGKIPVQPSEFDMAAFSAHKFFGPKGIGGVYARDPSLLEPMLLGGGHEQGLRSGTLNVPAIVGMGEAARLGLEHLEEHARHALACRTAVLEELADADASVNASMSQTPHILSLTFPGLTAETLVLEANVEGFAVSAGAACSSRETEPSPSLLAAGLTEAEALSTIRISFGPDNTVESSRSLAAVLHKASKRLTKMRNP